MDFHLEEHHLALQQTVRRFAENEITPLVAELDEREEFPCHIIRKLGELGIMGLPFPREYGGVGADALSLIIALEELARADSSVAVTIEATVSLAGQLLFRYGTEDQKRQWLVPLAKGEVLGSFGLTEPDAGSDTNSIATTAVLDGDQWVINGSKNFITNAGTEMSGFIVVAAVSGERDGKKEFSSIIVPSGTPGYNVGKAFKKIGWHASDTREISFDDCRVPAENLLGETGHGRRQFLESLTGARIAFAAMAVGLAQTCLDLSLSYAQKRVQFGRPLIEHQAIQFKLADMAMNVELARMATYKAACLMDEGAPFRKEAAIAKLFATEAAVKIAEEAVQIHGGYGYIRETPISRFYRDSKILTIAEGTSEVHRMIIARELVSQRT